jgi:hypothetical protein
MDTVCFSAQQAMFLPIQTMAEIGDRQLAKMEIELVKKRFLFRVNFSSPFEASAAFSFTTALDCGCAPLINQVNGII